MARLYRARRFVPLVDSNLLADVVGYLLRIALERRVDEEVVHVSADARKCIEVVVVITHRDALRPAKPYNIIAEKTDGFKKCVVGRRIFLGERCEGFIDEEGPRERNIGELAIPWVWRYG